MYYNTDKDIYTKENYDKDFGIIENNLTLKDWNITKKEIVELCLNVTLKKEISLCRPEKEKLRIWKILNSNLTPAIIKRNLASVKDLRPQIDEEYNPAMVKLRVIEETINNCYKEKFDKIYNNGKNSNNWLMLCVLIEFEKFHKEL